MVNFTFSLALFVGVGVGGVVIYRLIDRRLTPLVLFDSWKQYLYTVPLSLLLMMFFLAGIVGLGMLDLVATGQSDDAWIPLFLMLPSFCGIYAFLRYHLYGKHKMDAEMNEYFSTRQRVRRAIGILEGQGFNVYEANEDYYIISHPRDEVQTLRGGIETPALISIAERLEPLLLHAELQGKPTYEVLIKFDRSYSLN